MHDEDPRWDRQWRRMEAMARRGMRRFGNLNFNLDSSQWAGGLRAGKMLASGDVRLVALSLIEKQPRHGYDLIKAIEDMSKGFYSPSPGVVYPALTYLEEAGFTTSRIDGNKKLYSITETGRAHLDENREAVDSTLNFLSKAGSKMREWGERMASPDFPFTSGQAPGFRERQRDNWPPHGEEPRTQPTDAAETTPADLDTLRKAIKKAVRRAETEGPAEERRVAIILAEALRAIRAGRRDRDPDTAL